MGFNLPEALLEREKPQGSSEGTHPLIVKRRKERDESNGPTKRKQFLRDRYSKDIGSGDSSSAADEQSDIPDGVSGDTEQLF